jgi:UDP-N-acetylmuramoylalanine-D-glutamate ligase
MLIGNIGTPALEELDNEFDFYVIELSSFQIDLLKNSSCQQQLSMIRLSYYGNERVLANFYIRCRNPR